MRKFVTLVGLFLFSGLLMAAGEGDAAGSVQSWAPIVGMAIGAGLCGIGQGNAVSAACEGIARNPGAGGNIRTTLIIGLALIESLALYVLLIAFAKY